MGHQRRNSSPVARKKGSRAAMLDRILFTITIACTMYNSENSNLKIRKNVENASFYSSTKFWLEFSRSIKPEPRLEFSKLQTRSLFRQH